VLARFIVVYAQVSIESWQKTADITSAERELLLPAQNKDRNKGLFWGEFPQINHYN